MHTYEKIRQLREQNHWSQEDMAEKMEMSQSGYARIERGETKLHIDKLKQIAQIFKIVLLELIELDDKTISLSMSNNGSADYAQGLNVYHTYNNYYGNETVAIEIEKLKLSLNYKEEIISKLEEEITTLKELIALLKNK